MQQKIRPLRTGARLAGAVASGLVAILLAYGAAGMIGGAIPTNAGWREAPTGVRIHIESNGIHTGIVVPVAAAGIDWRDLVRPEDLRDPGYAGYDHLAIGWGDRAFYLETPTWADVRPGTVLSAAIGSEHSVMHVDHVPEPRIGDDEDGDIRTIVLRPEEYRRLAAFIRASFRAEQGRHPAHQFGYADYDVFYDAHGRYSAIETCNAWTGDALRHAGVRIGAWTPFPVTVLGWFSR